MAGAIARLLGISQEIITHQGEGIPVPDTLASPARLHGRGMACGDGVIVFCKERTAHALPRPCERRPILIGDGPPFRATPCSGQRMGLGKDGDG